MIKNLITELTRAREIMGLKDKNYNLLNEQTKYLVDDFTKAFLRTGLSKEAVEALAIRVELLFGKTSMKKLGTLVERMSIESNLHITKTGIIKLKSFAGGSIRVSTIDKIIAAVSTGKLKGAQVS